MNIIDISPLISSNIDVWPGDIGYRRDLALDMQRGDHLTLSSIQSTLHVGAHADAPNHYHKDGCDIAERDLQLYFGECQVIEVNIARGERVQPNHLHSALNKSGGDLQAPRVLFKTSSFPDHENWNSDFNSLSPELIEELAANGVRLVGLDTPSIDPQDAKILHAHHAVAKNDMAILEGLVLAHVQPGAYTLCALPLKIADADASPVRAVLLQVST